MEKKEIKAIIMDGDGSTITDTNILPDNLRILMEGNPQIHWIMATGRSLELLQKTPITPFLSKDVPHIVDGGAKLMYLSGKRSLDHFISEKELDLLFSQIVFRDLNFIYYSPDGIRGYAYSAQVDFLETFRFKGGEITHTLNTDQFINWTKKLPPSKILINVKAGRDINLKGLYYHRSENYIDITPQGINKGTACVELLQQLKIAPREAAFVFNDYNDLPVIQNEKLADIVRVKVGGVLPDVASHYQAASPYEVSAILKNLLFLFLFIFYGVLGSDYVFAAINTPAEFSNQESVWLAWPQIEPRKGHSNIPQLVEIISAITESGEYVDLIVNDKTEEAKAKHFLDLAIVQNKDKIRFHMIKHSDFWMRDMGAIFVRDDKGHLAAVSLKFNSWGMATLSKSFKESSVLDGKISEAMAKSFSIPIIKTSFLVTEGGALEFNGSGTLITTESVIFQRERNPGLSKTRAEAELKRLFGLKNIIWLKQGIVADDSVFYGPLQGPKGPVLTALTTNGHTDEFVRWISEDTVLLAEVTEAEARKAGKGSIVEKTRQRLEESYHILRIARNQAGKPLKIIRIPAAEEIFEDLKVGDGTFDALSDMKNSPAKNMNHASFISATSYLNYLVTNKLVLMPQYWKEGRPALMKEKDERARKIIQAAFPDRTVITIQNVEDINIGGGGIHCISQQMPLL